jgi:hypothetical protein
MERTTAGSDSEFERRSDRQHEPDGSASGGAGRGSVAALHGAVGNQAVQEGTSASERARAGPTEGESAGSETTESSIQRRSSGSSPARSGATDTDRDATAGLCSRCARRYRAGKSLDCPDCEAALQRSVDPATRNGTSGGVVQPKLAVNRPDDPAEREAERVADEVAGTDDTRDVTVSRRASGGGTVDGGTESEIRAATTDGRPLAEPTRSTFESRFGRDFSDVRVHTGPEADAAARSIDAEAFTHGSDIVFARGNYRPNSAGGRRLLAHELTHVVQQGGASAGTTAGVQRQSGGQKQKNQLSSPRFEGNETLEKVRRGEILLGGRRAQSDSDTKYALKLIQAALVEADYDVEVDGEYDIDTSAAVKQFQDDVGITETLGYDGRGSIGAKTMAALDDRFPEPDQPTTTGGKNPGQTQWDPYDPTCLLDIFCEWNEPIVEDFRRGDLELVTFTEAYNKVWRADEEGWEEDKQYIQGFLEGDAVGIEKGVTCLEAAYILYQEWFHAQQSSYMPKKEREIQAWTAQEMWLLAQDLPTVKSEFRQMGSDPPKIDTGAVREHVVSAYSDIDRKDGESGPGDVQPRTDESGNPLDRVVTGETNINTSNWKCSSE